MSLVDSFGWIEFFNNGPLSPKYKTYLEPLDHVITPTIILYEVYKKMRREASKDVILLAIGKMKRTRIIPLNDQIALYAVHLSLDYDLPMADSIIYATALNQNTKVVTSDPHFKNLPEVIFIE